MSIDNVLTQSINGLAGHLPALDALMIAITQFGIPLMVLAVVPLWWSRSRRGEARYLATSAALTFLGGLAINQLVLLFIELARPYTVGLTHLLIAPSSDPSFPSDHSTAAMAITATFLLHRRYRLGAAFGAASLLVMMSRIYVGTHYVSDVIGGLITAVTAAMLVSRYYRQEGWLNRRLARVL